MQWIGREKMEAVSLVLTILVEIKTVFSPAGANDWMAVIWEVVSWIAAIKGDQPVKAQGNH